MRDDFCAFILTHGRPDRVHTLKTLRRSGYTGKVYIVIDDEDKTEAEYRKRFGDRVLQFSKEAIAKTFDEGDNFNDRRAIIYARNACWDLARQVGVRYFIQLDDDYYIFGYRLGKYVTIHTTMDDCLSSMVEFLEESNAATIAMSQGGDHIGGESPISMTRKAMNSFVCSVERPFQFVGRINEDVNTYTNNGRLGRLFCTVMPIQLDQKDTQSNVGGMTGTYIDGGTYIKTFYAVMYSPSCVKVSVLGDPRSPHYRIHHKINWHHTAPKILREEYRKARNETKVRWKESYKAVLGLKEATAAGLDI